MEKLAQPELFFYILMTLLWGAVTYFLKQLHSDFKKVEKDVSEVKSTTAIIRAEFKGNNEVIIQRIEFLEKRVSHLENINNINDE